MLFVFCLAHFSFSGRVSIGVAHVFYLLVLLCIYLDFWVSSCFPRLLVFPLCIVLFVSLFWDLSVSGSGVFAYFILALFPRRYFVSCFHASVILISSICFAVLYCLVYFFAIRALLFFAFFAQSGICSLFVCRPRGILFELFVVLVFFIPPSSLLLLLFPVQFLGMRFFALAIFPLLWIFS